MAKCIKCGKSTVIRGHVKLADAAICAPCYKSLGFGVSSVDLIIAKGYKWDDIKDGKDEYDKRHWAKMEAQFAQNEEERLGLFFADYQVLDKLDCSDNEMKAVERTLALLDDEGCNVKKICFEREPGGPLSAFVGDELLYELKYSKDVKWIRLSGNDKVRISGPAGINKLASKLSEKYKEITAK